MIYSFIMMHPDDELFAQYIDGKLSEDEQIKFLGHLEECSDCSTLYAMADASLDTIEMERIQL